ncbi:mitochondrial ubiquitin ligase activator of nfkb 1 [Biomphalaria glabrata]|nr:mitochondrial ubiquitin ligase activator of nfkb 1-like [Biomphalaria glabrata]KAI8782840.1 mitochondrial ubiquitin ligase activator of nfkb 1 [Biomphalaria glabrata]
MVVIDVVDKVVSVGGALANILAFVLYKYYRNRSETARLVKQTTIWNPDAELYDHLNQQKDHSLQYAVVEGVVKDLGRVLQGRYSKNDGVILHTEIIEHQSKRVNGFWSDMKKAIKDSTEIVPFAIANVRSKEPKFQVEVLDPLQSPSIYNELETTYDHFEPNKNTFMQNSLDRLFGEVTKGIQETESMLLTGTSVIGVGKVFLERGALKMAAADDPNRTFILTKMRKPELVRTLESQSSTFKMLSVLCFVIGGSMLGYLIWRHVKKILEEKKRRQEFEEIQRVLQSSQSTQGSHNEDSRADETCVVCLSNPRQVITLNCGHIAMCATCAELLPYPKKCPVCRADIERFVAVYRP